MLEIQVVYLFSVIIKGLYINLCLPLIISLGKNPGRGITENLGLINERIMKNGRGKCNKLNELGCLIHVN